MSCALCSVFYLSSPFLSMCNNQWNIAQVVQDVALPAIAWHESGMIRCRDRTTLSFFIVRRPEGRCVFISFSTVLQEGANKWLGATMHLKRRSVHWPTPQPCSTVVRRWHLILKQDLNLPSEALLSPCVMPTLMPTPCRCEWVAA